VEKTEGADRPGTAGKGQTGNQNAQQKIRHFRAWKGGFRWLKTAVRNAVRFIFQVGSNAPQVRSGANGSKWI
jgi:hypothetical protein